MGTLTLCLAPAHSISKLLPCCSSTAAPPALRSMSFLCHLGPKMHYLHISLVYVFQRSWNKLSNVAKCEGSRVVSST